MADIKPELNAAYRSVFEDQPIKNVTRGKINVVVIHQDGKEEPISSAIIQKLLVEKNGGVTIDWDYVGDTRPRLLAAFAVIYGKRTTEGDIVTFTHKSGTLLFGWQEVLAYGRTPLNMERRADSSGRVGV